MESTELSRTKRVKSFLVPKTPPKVWWGYIIIIPLIYVSLSGMMWLTLLGIVILLADRIYMHFRYIGITAAGLHLSKSYQAQYEISLLTEEVEAEQRQYMTKKMQENEEE